MQISLAGVDHLANMRNYAPFSYAGVQHFPLLIVLESASLYVFRKNRDRGDPYSNPSSPNLFCISDL